MKDNFDVYYENYESERMILSDIFYLIRNYRLIQVSLDNGYSIRQWKDTPATIEINGETFDMEYGKVYCSIGSNIVSVWNGWGEDELKDYIETCSKYI